MLLNDAALGNKTLFLTTSSDLISTTRYRNHLAKNSTPLPYCGEINISLCVLQGVKLRLIQAPMRLNFSLWRPNPES